jgi:hypothetical protein
MHPFEISERKIVVEMICPEQNYHQNYDGRNDYFLPARFFHTHKVYPLPHEVSSPSEIAKYSGVR